MRLSKTIQVMAMFTAMSLIYTHLQMKIYDLAYQGKQKEKEVNEIFGNNSMVAYEIMKLKSSQHLGVTFLAENPSLKFSDEAKVVQLVAADSVGESQPTTTLSQTRVAQSLLSLLSLRSEAEARPAEKR
jgi:hypothetical protein